MYNQLVKGILILVKGIDAFIESIQSMCGSNDIIQSMESIEPYQVYRNFRVLEIDSEASVLLEVLEAPDSLTSLLLEEAP